MAEHTWQLSSMTDRGLREVLIVTHMGGANFLLAVTNAGEHAVEIVSGGAVLHAVLPKQSVALRHAGDVSLRLPNTGQKASANGFFSIRPA